MVERWPFKPRVLGSSPSAPSFTNNAKELGFSSKSIAGEGCREGG